MPHRRHVALGLLGLLAGCAADVPARGGGRPPPGPRPTRPGGNSGGPAVTPLDAPYEVVSSANLRAGPGTGHRVLTGIKAGTTVRAIGRAEGGWLKVRAGRSEGFIQQDLLRPASQGSGVDELPTPQEEAE